MKVGQAAEILRSFTAEDVADYVKISGHTADGTTVPEPLIHALFSYLLGIKLPGIGTNYLKQESRFLQTATVGQTLLARVEITRLRPDKHLVDLHTSCNTGDGRMICEGRALVSVRDVPV